MDALTRSATLAGHEQRVVLRGCRDMLKEAAKQFRLNNDPGHAGLCELHKAKTEGLLQHRNTKEVLIGTLTKRAYG